jgi:hypothetical protein
MGCAMQQHGIRNPAGYLFGIIQRAIHGEFNAWAKKDPPAAPVPPNERPPPPTPPPSQPQGSLCRRSRQASTSSGCANLLSPASVSGPARR